jgi:hypothetical protein
LDELDVQVTDMVIEMLLAAPKLAEFALGLHAAERRTGA